MYGLNQGVLHEVYSAQELVIAEVCHRQGPVCRDYVNDLASAIVTYLITGMPGARDRFNMMRADDFANENVRQATVIILDQMRSYVSKDRGRISRLARVSSYVNQSQVA